jgi:CxxC motif-containing protein (DUF1111 family)
MIGATRRDGSDRAGSGTDDERGEPAMKSSRLSVVLAGLVATIVLVPACAEPPAPVELDDPLPGLTPVELARFEEGEAIFEGTFTPEQGLGPLFNAEGCAACHNDPVDGGNGAVRELHASGRGAEGTCDLLFDQGGPVVQQRATPALVAATGLTSEPLPPGTTATGLRSTPDVFGFGLLDAVPDATIRALADPDDRDGDGISGRVNATRDGRVGRFGRKAAVSSLLDFNEGAFLLEIGLTTSRQPFENSLAGAPLPAGVDPVPEPEVAVETVALTSDYVRFLAPPAPGPQGAREAHGERVFARIGCAACHVPALVTGPHAVAALSRKVVHAYSDLLLHDMGPELADTCAGEAEPSEFRTEPLMGLRHVRAFLHDGRATSVEAAIEAHGGEGTGARTAFRELGPEDHQALLAFLASL